MCVCVCGVLKAAVWVLAAALVGSCRMLTGSLPPPEKAQTEMSAVSVGGSRISSLCAHVEVYHLMPMKLKAY